MSGLSSYVIPLVIMLIPLVGLVRGVNVYEVFVEGAKHGIKTVVNILPYLIAMLLAVNMFKASGAMDIIVNTLGRFTSVIGSFRWLFCGRFRAGHPWAWRWG